ELEQGGAVNEAEGPVGPAARSVAALRREHRDRASFFGEIDGQDLGSGDLPETLHFFAQIRGPKVIVDLDHGWSRGMGGSFYERQAKACQSFFCNSRTRGL